MTTNWRAAWSAALIACCVACGGGSGDSSSGASSGTNAAAQMPGMVSFTVKNLPTGKSAVLSLNDGSALAVTGSGSYTFPTPVAIGSRYELSVVSLPPAYSCNVARGVGTMGAQAVTDPVVVCRSADQSAYDAMYLAAQGGGVHTVSASLPTFGTPTADYTFMSIHEQLDTSPAESGGTLGISSYASLTSNLGLSQVVAGTSIVLKNGQLWPHSFTPQQRLVRFVGEAIQTDYLADDGITVLWSLLKSNYSQAMLSGTISDGIKASPVLSTSVLAPLSQNTSLLTPNAAWLPGASIWTYKSVATTDRMFVINCISGTRAYFTAEVQKCATASTLEAWMTQINGAEAKANITQVDGVKRWTIPTSSTAYFELNGDVYRGQFIAAGNHYGTAVVGSPFPVNWVLNQAAIDSLKAGITF